MVKGSGVGLGRFCGSPGSPGEVGRMRATGDHSGTISRAKSATRPESLGPQRCGIPHQYSLYLDSPVVLVPRSACTGDDPAQPHPVPPILEPKLLNRLRDVLHPHLHSVEVRPSTVHQPAHRRRATRGLAGIASSTLSQQKKTQGSNIPDDVPHDCIPAAGITT